MVGSYLGRISQLYNEETPNSCWAYFEGGSIDGVNQTLGWKRLNAGPSPESNNMFVALAAEAKSNDRWVAVFYRDDAITIMWVFQGVSE